MPSKKGKKTGLKARAIGMSLGLLTYLGTLGSAISPQYLKIHPKKTYQNFKSLMGKVILMRTNSALNQKVARKVPAYMKKKRKIHAPYTLWAYTRDNRTGISLVSLGFPKLTNLDGTKQKRKLNPDILSYRVNEKTPLEVDKRGYSTLNFGIFSSHRGFSTEVQLKGAKDEDVRLSDKITKYPGGITFYVNLDDRRSEDKKRRTALKLKKYGAKNVPLEKVLDAANWKNGQEKFVQITEIAISGGKKSRLIKHGQENQKRCLKFFEGLNNVPSDYCKLNFPNSYNPLFVSSNFVRDGRYIVSKTNRTAISQRNLNGRQYAVIIYPDTYKNILTNLDDIRKTDEERVNDIKKNNNNTNNDNTNNNNTNNNNTNDNNNSDPNNKKNPCYNDVSLSDAKHITFCLPKGTTIKNNLDQQFKNSISSIIPGAADGEITAKWFSVLGDETDLALFNKTYTKNFNLDRNYEDGLRLKVLKEKINPDKDTYFFEMIATIKDKNGDEHYAYTPSMITFDLEKKVAKLQIPLGTIKTIPLKYEK